MRGGDVEVRIWAGVRVCSAPRGRKGKSLPCSSTSSLWPGLVLSATVLANMVMKFSVSFLVHRENSLRSKAAESCTAGFSVLRMICLPGPLVNFHSH